MAGPADVGREERGCLPGGPSRGGGHIRTTGMHNSCLRWYLHVRLCPCNTTPSDSCLFDVVLVTRRRPRGCTTRTITSEYDCWGHPQSHPLIKAARWAHRSHAMRPTYRPPQTQYAHDHRRYNLMNCKYKCKCEIYLPWIWPYP